MPKSTDIYQSKILKQYDGELLFTLAGFDVTDGEVCNPLRNDSAPGCFYEYYNDILYFYDFTYFFGKAGINGVEAIKEAYGLDTNAEVLEFIEENKDGADVNKISKTKPSEVRVEFESGKWGTNNYYTKYGKELCSEILDKEGVHLVKSYRASSKKYPSLILNLIGDPDEYLTIAYNKNGRTKLYRPYDPHIKWYGNITADDIWGIEDIDGWYDYITILGSMKDYLVAKYVIKLKNCIGLQSEWPKFPKIIEEKFADTKKFVIFDSDETGNKNMKKLHEDYKNVKIVNLPQIKDRYGRVVGKDLSDLVEVYGGGILNYKI